MTTDYQFHPTAGSVVDWSDTSDSTTITLPYTAKVYTGSAANWSPQVKSFRNRIGEILQGHILEISKDTESYILTTVFKSEDGEIKEVDYEVSLYDMRYQEVVKYLSGLRMSELPLGPSTGEYFFFKIISDPLNEYQFFLLSDEERLEHIKDQFIKNV